MHIPALGSTVPAPRDRFGQPCQIGDIVYYSVDPAPMWKVTGIRPDVRPTSPPGTVVLTLQSSAEIALNPLAPAPTLHRLGYVDPAGRVVIGSAVPDRRIIEVPDSPPSHGTQPVPGPPPDPTVPEVPEVPTDPATPGTHPDSTVQVPTPGPKLVQ